jgi:hypothetical protein
MRWKEGAPKGNQYARKGRMWSGFSSEMERTFLRKRSGFSTIVACGAASHLRLKLGVGGECTYASRSGWFLLHRLVRLS